MHVLILGGSGLIGGAVAVRLAADGHFLTLVSRRGGGLVAPGVRRVALDLAASARAEAWSAHLSGVDAVVNCAGVLQDGPDATARSVHLTAPEALYQACVGAGVRRVVLLSAIGVDRMTPTDFSATKSLGEERLRSFDLDWVILRPSVVVGRPAYGGSALFRGLAASPLLPVMPGGGRLQIVQLDEVADTIVRFLAPTAPARLALDLAGPDQLLFEDVVDQYRKWLGWRPARRLHLPEWFAGLVYKTGDLIGSLGWRTPVRSNARLEMRRGATGDNRAWREIMNIAPHSLADALAREPASVQEKWFAGLYLLKPLAFAVFVAFWIGTGVVSLGPGWEIGRRIMAEGGVVGPLADLAIVAGALSDIVIGCLIAWRRTSRLGLYAALAISIVYAVLGTYLVPALWAEPLGPMLKIWPIVVFNLVLLAILEDR